MINSPGSSSEHHWEFLHYHMVGMAANIADDGKDQNEEKSNRHYHRTWIDDEAREPRSVMARIYQGKGTRRSHQLGRRILDQ